MSVVLRNTALCITHRSFKANALLTPGVYGDWSQWWHRTPGGNMLANESNNDLHRTMLKCRKVNSGSRTVERISLWYFYKSRIAGLLHENHIDSYSIVNEKECSAVTRACLSFKMRPMSRFLAANIIGFKEN